MEPIEGRKREHRAHINVNKNSLMTTISIGTMKLLGLGPQSRLGVSRENGEFYLFLVPDNSLINQSYYHFVKTPKKNPSRINSRPVARALLAKAGVIDNNVSRRYYVEESPTMKTINDVHGNPETFKMYKVKT